MALIIQNYILLNDSTNRVIKYKHLLAYIKDKFTR